MAEIERIEIEYFKGELQRMQNHMDKGFADLGRKLDDLRNAGMTDSKLVAVHESRIAQLERERTQLWDKLDGIEKSLTENTREVGNIGWALLFKLIGGSALVSGSGVAAAMSLLK